MSGTTAHATVGNIVDAVITEMSQVPGQATQIYATPRITQHVQDAVLLEIEEMWWPMLMMYQQVGIDFATGLPMADLRGSISFIDEWHDIAAVYPDGSSRRMPELPQSINPYTLVDGSSGRATYVSADSTMDHRPFRVWPAINCNVVVHARQRPALPMSITDRVYLDRLLLIYDACWMYAVDDGTIPAQVNKFQVLAANRRKRIKAAYASQPLLLDPGHTTTMPSDESWFVLDQDPLA